MEQQEIDELKALRSRNQVTSFNQFSDVRPTDLAYQALTNLVKNMVAWPAIPTAPTRVGRQDRTTFNYDLRLNLDTSFTGKDLLKTRLRSGNFTAFSPFNAGDSLFKLDKASSTNAGASGVGGLDTVSIDRLYYQFPVGKQFTLTAGALVRNTEILAFIPSAYRSQLLDFFAVAGTPGAYNKVTGQGFGAVWKQQVAKGQGLWNASLNYIAQDGEISNEGIFDSDGSLNTTAQIGYKAPNW